MDKDFEKRLETFIQDYINKKFPADLKECYGNVIGVLKAGIYAGATFTKTFYSKKNDERPIQ